MSAHPTDRDLADALARRIFATLSTKWALTALEALADGPRRFAELHRALDGISHKMLTQTLRALESDGLVARHDHATANPRVDYALTPAGSELLATVYGLCAWSRTHLDTLLGIGER
ncbi:helix-turn-helix transcriptional regulator [Nocardia puris]|uniref:HxlR family transcriptional regulator n=1 Tax=Nocardia puris TaxID=208602 RepID=A0A366E159_9NOCA|nr:helix-turn-helix domain-containing protein [Nocardia puris]MBF6209622.1 helix-turn-helix transcriptional regulator [Nocardia puris]MBF6366194.1 helix-turn-helix transcriptional regulator [Nocardia puris]MBF6458467.1 helix-turn-helix transcriptional regulator [Nocardia puris]RBO96111.1 HxlR family transcriptional regulator [Nocardia puris]